MAQSLTVEYDCFISHFQHEREMLKRVQHDIKILAFVVCHPEPCPEASSGSIDFGILALVSVKLGFKASPLGRVLD